MGKGWIKSLDPSALEIGPSWCEVNVQVAIKKREHLIRPYGLFITNEDAIATIAWPCTFNSMENFFQESTKEGTNYEHMIYIYIYIEPSSQQLVLPKFALKKHEFHFWTGFSLLGGGILIII